MGQQLNNYSILNYIKICIINITFSKKNYELQLLYPKPGDLNMARKNV